MKKLFGILLLLVLFLGVIRICSTSHSSISLKESEQVTISQLRDNINAHARQAVILSGIVETSFYFGIIGGGFYMLNDGTGVVAVLKGSFTPSPGDRVIVAVEPKPLLRLGAKTVIITTEIKILRTEKQDGIQEERQNYSFAN